MEKKTLAIILIGTAVVIGGGTTVYIVGKKKGWFGEKPDENDPLAENNAGNTAIVQSGGGSNSSSGGSAANTTGQSSVGTVWDTVYLPNKDQNISDISKDAKKLLQYTINEVYAGSSKIKIDGAVGPATRVSFYYCLKAMYPTTFKENPFDLEKKGGIKTIMKNYKFGAFIDTACRYLAGDKKTLKNISASEIQNMVNNVPKSAIGLSGFSFGVFGI